MGRNEIVPVVHACASISSNSERARKKKKKIACPATLLPVPAKGQRKSLQMSPLMTCPTEKNGKFAYAEPPASRGKALVDSSISAPTISCHSNPNRLEVLEDIMRSYEIAKPLMTKLNLPSRDQCTGTWPNSIKVQRLRADLEQSN